MRILLINHYAGSLDYGMEYRPFYFAREWVKRGHVVDIIAASFSHLRSKNPEVKKDLESEQIDNITYHWIKTIYYKGNSIKRALNMISFVFKLYCYAKKIAKELKPDVVIASSTYPLDTYPARKIARLTQAKLVHEIHDMWPLTLIELGKMSRWHPFVVLMQIAENTFCKYSDIIISLLPLVKDYLLNHGMHIDAYHYIPNGVVLADWNYSFDLPKKHNNIMRILKDRNKFIVCYFGGHSISNALNILIEAAKKLELPGIHFVLLGDGSEKTSLQQMVINEKLKNVTFLPPISKLSIPNFLKQCDCIYIGGKNSPLYRFGVSFNKLYDSMMSGKPIIYAIDAPNNDVIDYNCGIAIKPDDANEIVKAIDVLFHMDIKSRENMGENGKKAVLANYEYEILAKKFEYILQGKKFDGFDVEY